MVMKLRKMVHFTMTPVWAVVSKADFLGLMVEMLTVVYQNEL